MSHPDLELALHRRDGDAYSLEMRFSDPASEVDRTHSGAQPIRFDAVELRQRADDAAAYGDLLGSQLLADPAGRSFFDQAVAVSQTQGQPLRIRLTIGPSAPELHSLRWETLRLPGVDSPLLTDETLRFSRYLNSLDWRPVNLRPEGELRALVVVANPNDLARYRLAAVDAVAEETAARAGLGSIQSDALTTQGQVTLENITQRLRDNYDILYLVAHGMLVEGEPWLFLEQADGSTERVPGHELATRIREAQQRPRLVVLASCQSAGAGVDPTPETTGALSALGPRLAEAGVPAVIAMQGNVSIETVGQFMPVLFEELRRDGVIDRAVAAARSHVRQRPDWWMPVLFMRLRSGRISYKPGFGDDLQALRKWPALVNNIKSGRCTPILGPGTSEWLFGSRRAIAQRWAEAFGFPMDAGRSESLPQVAQYVAVDQDLNFMREQLVAHLRQEVMRHLDDPLPPDMADASLDELISAAGARYASQHDSETYRVLAALPLPIYITTNPGNLLGDALRAAGKAPVVEICRWNEELTGLPSIYDSEPDYRP
ncbi:MAG TPA: CHAT domain-containing protein, partial [Anaerolineae bacterium]|nr:CHAT domain-containing protein [Anaerolineae bacterium]